MPLIRLPQKNLSFEAPNGANLMTFLQSKQIPVASSCLGDGICSKCRVKIKGLLPNPSELEANTLKRNRCAPDERLACQITIESNLEVFANYW